MDKSQAAPAGLQGDKLTAKVACDHPGQHSLSTSKADHLPEVMDGLMQKKNMKAADFPRIEYTLKELTFKGPHTAGQPFTFDADGELTIAGATKRVSFPVTIEPLDGGKIMPRRHGGCQDDRLRWLNPSPAELRAGFDEMRGRRKNPI